MRWLILFFVALLLAGGFPGWMDKLRLGRLPGDLRFRFLGRDVRVPLGSALVLSLIANWLIHWVGSHH